MLWTLEEEQNHLQNEGTWAPFQFHIFRKKDEPLTPKKVLKEKTFSFDKSLMERNN